MTSEEKQGWSDYAWVCACGATGKGGTAVPPAHAACADVAMRELHKARQEMLTQQIAAKRAYEAKVDAYHQPITAKAQGGTHVAFDGLTTLNAGVVAVGHAVGARTFTREEVLTVLRDRQIGLPEVSTERALLDALIRTFERME